ncbi:SRPBCC family protein [Terracoccus luteus]|uniref:Uncharacterized protein YndB with AHSA1/START domain n=1 Tax=Terracoccus luteus TaxID=53356 RepID=A0A839PYM9_9MICO|nr:SRPBCC domain-containing protein [Terracoccus luteus]MBB2987096.1 uncharacterized protein YndB with AHSA1/START domain [Terracoccus luteus]MCP2172747.1 uncharacterized protein YndB with AHSA1/START domain [Terracoccus luteus]
MSSDSSATAQGEAGDEAVATGDSGIGTTSTAGTVHVSREVGAPVEQVWQHLISTAGTEALLGPGARLGGKGESWRSTDGPHGVVRSYHPIEQLRVSWHADDDAPASLVDLHLVDAGESTTVDVTHERLTADDPHPDVKGHWSQALDRFADSLT